MLTQQRSRTQRGPVRPGATRQARRAIRSLTVPVVCGVVSAVSFVGEWRGLARVLGDSHTAAAVLAALVVAGIAMFAIPPASPQVARRLAATRIIRWLPTCMGLRRRLVGDLARHRPGRLIHALTSAPQVRPTLGTCRHSPRCPAADADDREAARTVAFHPEQGWSRLCNGVILFDDTGELLPDGTVIAPHRGPALHRPASPTVSPGSLAAAHAAGQIPS